MRITFSGYHRVRCVVIALLSCSQWFAVTPLPDDRWSVEVKPDAAPVLGRWMDANHGLQVDVDVATEENH